ncbi:MAG: hypothetical protein GX775_00740 [Erysipelothrix sp.]|nr:hypothetical protein [Erysipelothrix sp.]
MTTLMLRLVILIPMIILYTVLLVVANVVYMPEMAPAYIWIAYFVMIGLTSLIVFKSKTLKAMTTKEEDY